MRCFLLLLAMMVGRSGFSQTHAPVRLKPDQTLTVIGTLMMRPAGRLQFVTVKATVAYVSPIDNKPVHEIAIAGYRDYALLYAHRGQTVTVSGVLRTEDASPYYRDGMRLDVTSVVAAHGENLIGSEALPDFVLRGSVPYIASAILPTDLAAPWRYVVDGRKNVRGPLSCSSNGGGDVVNCFCLDGFHPVSAVSTVGGEDAKGEIFADARMAQFGVGDEARGLTLTVICSR